MKIAKTVIFLQQNEDDANEMDLIAEGKKHNKSPPFSNNGDDEESDGSEVQSTFRLDTLTSQMSEKFNKKFKEQFKDFQKNREARDEEEEKKKKDKMN